MKWLRRRFWARRPKRVSELDRQLKLGLLQDAMGRVEKDQREEPDTRPGEDRHAGCRPVAAGASWRLRLTG